MYDTEFEVIPYDTYEWKEELADRYIRNIFRLDDAAKKVIGKRQTLKLRCNRNCGRGSIYLMSRMPMSAAGLCRKPWNG